MLVLRLVAQRRETAKPKNISDISRTVGSGDLAPDHSDLGASDLLLRLVDVRDLLAKVEAISNALDPTHVSTFSRLHVLGGGGFVLYVLGSAGVIDAFDLDQTRLRVGGVLVPLVAEVTSPEKDLR